MSRPQEHRVTWYATRPDELHDLDALQYAERSARYAIAQAESLAAAARGYLAQLYTRAQQIIAADYHDELYFYTGATLQRHLLHYGVAPGVF